MAASAASGILRPWGEMSLMPLSSAGLCEAEMTTPRAQAQRRVRQDAGAQDVDSGGAEAFDEGLLDGGPGGAGVAADEDLAGAEGIGSGRAEGAEGLGEGRGEEGGVAPEERPGGGGQGGDAVGGEGAASGAVADAVGAEDLSHREDGV